MKTRLIESLALDNMPKPIRESFTSLVRVSESDLTPLIAFVIPHLLSSRTLSPETTEDLTGEFSLTHEEARARFTAVSFLLTALRDQRFAEDAPQDLARDMVEAGLLGESDLERAVPAIAAIKKAAVNEFRTQARKREAAVQGEPWLINVEIAPGLKPAFTEDYQIGQDVAEYSPSLIGLEPIVSVVLTIADAPVEKVAFSMNLDQLEDTVSLLQATARQLEEVNRALRLPPDSDQE